MKFNIVTFFILFIYLISFTAGPSTIKVEVAKNDGQKSMLKPIVVKSDDFDVFLKLACNQLRLKYPSLSPFLPCFPSSIYTSIVCFSL